ncbi:testis-expressed protein 2-like [Cynara cardunculus var. scolymus]|uniref:SMP-LTD domain-containing protein n=1 Tax=Cynara cardunculus var. scolymus TaxID=59895 RepID=A0A103YE77_CYNCS|nr:testis-expressed protein 2-like [Cynara cardunculus var. scolymus]KVI07466.1 protein of unknown function DUF2404 [Cynara cardunculus var. scolymus]
MVIVALFVGFVFGALAVVGVEVLGVLFLIRKLSKKVDEEDVKITKSGSSGREELQFSFPNKQGWVWVLEKERIPKTSPPTDKGLRQQKRKIEILEVSPVRKYASIKDQSLVVTEPDGTLTKVSLLSCTVEAVSATNLPSRKWAKKYPVKVESKSSVIYHGSKLFYMYFETSSEKESWCKSLRLASSDDKEKLKWFDKLRLEFHNYLGSLNVEYPSFLKPTIGFNPDLGDKSIKIDGSSSKVRHFLKKLAKKTSKSGVENKTNWRSFSGREDKRVSERSSGVQESSSVGGSSRLSQTQKNSNYAVEEKIIQALTPRSTQSGSRSQGPLSSDTDSIDKITSDDGTLCCNLLLSRLFFDAKSNVELRKSIQARIQRTLSTIRTPSYIGEIICTGVDPGNIPPFIHGMRVLPTDLKEVVAMEIDIEYYGGAVLDIETRLEVQELENPESLDTNSDSKSVDDVTTDLLEGFEYFGEQLKLNEQKNQAMEQKGDEIRKLEEIKSFKGNEQVSSAVSKWKSVLNCVAKQVSQVPLSLAVRVTTLRGTLRVHIKPPPSDQLWFGFTSMPDIDFSLESSVGDHKITSGHIALFIISKFKAAIRETMVLPNSESVTIPFMLAEKNDWVPQKSAPFIWTNPEVTTEPTAESVIVHEVHRAQSSQETHPLEVQEARTSSARSTESIQDKLIDSLDDQKAVVSNVNLPDESKTALLESEEFPLQEAALQSIEENREVTSSNWQHPSPPQAMVAVEENDMMEGEDARLRRMGTRAKMLGLRKRMGEKLEEKRRNIEEKGRHIVEKMRGPGGI